MPVSVRESERALAELLDREAIFDVLRLERFWRDQGEWERLAHCYVEGARVRTTWFDGTAAEFVEASRRMARNGRHSKHLITPTHLRINGDRALAESLGWRLASFEGIYQRDTIQPVDPGRRLALDWDAVCQHRPSYRIWAYALSREGYDVPQDRVGDDRPDLLRAFYAAEDRWLETGGGE
jgi:hypothetical protein